MSDACPRCGSKAPTGRLGACPGCLLQAELPAPLVNDSLELIEEIGRGGMGTVYKARHLRLGRTVAVKFLPERFSARPEFKARFEREARALALLNHPNIVAVHDFGQEGDQSYIVMEFVDGVPLSRKMPMAAGRAVEIALQICDALAYAHKQGVIHRDIKPENILIDAEGRVKVTDFGIARIVRPDAASAIVTATHEAVGTPQYMAPEVMDGAPPDPRLDVYSLGVVIYEMITGKVPQGNFPPLPGALDAVVRKALALEVNLRYAAIDEMRRDLAAIPCASGSASDGLPSDERIWTRVVALLQAISTAVAVNAFVMCVTPQELDPANLRLWMVGRRPLASGKVLTLARFELWPFIAALATFAVAITAYGLLRRHWRLAGLERAEPDRPVSQTRWVLRLGLLAIGVFAFRKAMERFGQGWITPLVGVVGPMILTAMLFFLWLSILEAWRTSRPLRREPGMWIGLALSLVPPSFEIAGGFLSRI